MKQELTLGKGIDAIKIRVRKSDRAKRLQIRICPRRGAELVIPKRISVIRAKIFLHIKESWIRSILSKASPKPSQMSFLDRIEIPILGIMRQIIYTTTEVTSLENDRLIIHCASGNVPDAVRDFLYKLVREKLTFYVDEYTELLEANYGKISIRDTVSRWGSCSHNGNLSFCWRIIFAPESVMRYLVIHEVAHLKEKNHGKNFWVLVQRFCPDYKQHRSWLRKNSARLHSY